jgi:hypothetical protein
MQGLGLSAGAALALQIPITMRRSQRFFVDGCKLHQ